MHSMHNECLEMINPVLHDDSGQVQSNNNLNLKRKYPYDQTDDQCHEKSAKRMVNLHECHDAIDGNNVDQELIIYNNDKYMDHNTNHLNNEVNVEFINIMFDNNLLPVQQNTVISEANFISDAGWNSVDLLDLDQNVQEDCEDKNLSWLFNYKLDDLPHLSPEVNRSRTETGLKVDEIIQEATSTEVDESDMVVAENVVIENTQRMPKKPPFTYTELIEYALEDKGELTVSGIYQWISDRFPYYKSNDDRWKNSVRHNLSINPHFRKGSKAAQGAGHLWTISTRDSESNVLAWEHKKQRFDLFFKMEKSYSLSANSQTQPPQQSQSQSDSSNKCLMYDEATIAAANLSLINKQSSPEPNKSYNQQKNQQQNSFDHLHTNNADDLKRTAGEILNGVRRTVEVQVINPPSCLFQDNTVLDTDYLNPVPKDQIVRECGLRTVRNENDFYVTDIDPIELGVHMNSNGDDEVLFGDEFNLNYFGVVSGNNIMA
ncbi:forkhead box protein N3-like isoform X2 [Bradysia coprophila]|uniref:forkhead box protein N3-like isoform X2 n=1 Tax=Bradysia coprophila TaxID=38358 RepID=UPI00187DB3EC|nr:forkhead box protein N3-like isoform X2 [Bradysia coprophila]